MLVNNLGTTRRKLLESFSELTDEQLNQKPKNEMWSVSQVLFDIYTVEKDTALLILNSLKMESEKVNERDLSFINDYCKKIKATNEPSEKYWTRKEINYLLEQSRFLYVQAIFNETHEKILKEKSINHPIFGRISLKNLLDFIWLYELQYIHLIHEIKQEIFLK